MSGHVAPKSMYYGVFGALMVGTALTVGVAFIDLGALNKILKSKHKLVIDGGYGKLKGKTFRISNMGDETDETIASLLKSLDSALAETPKAAA